MEQLTFTNEFSKEVFNKDFYDCGSYEFFQKLTAYMLITGIEKTELVINNTFEKSISCKIIDFINKIIEV